MLNQNIGPEHLLEQVTEQLRVTDRLYRQAYEYFKICNMVVLIYSSVRTILLPYFIFEHATTHLSIFFTCMLAVSILQMVSYFLIRNISKQSYVFYTVAERTNHVRYMSPNELPTALKEMELRTVETYNFLDNESVEDDRQMKMLSLEIKYQIQQSNSVIFYLSRTQFAFYHIVHTWGFFLIMVYDIPSEAARTFLTVIILLSTYQYLEFYLIIIFLAVVLPFYGLKKLYAYLIIRYRIRQMERILKSEPLSDQIKGDRECNICLQAYQEGENIIVLKCSQLHNFHASCFREWAKTSSTCPLCRKNISDL